MVLSYIAHKLALNDEGRLVWRLKPHKGRLAAHDRGAGPVVKILGHDYPEPAVIDALNKGLGLERPASQKKRRLSATEERGITLQTGTQKYRAAVYADGQHNYLGLFPTLEDAIAARDEFIRRNNL